MEFKKEENIIEFHDTPWNFKSLKIKSNEISSVKIDTLSEFEFLLQEFENTCREEDVQFTAMRTGDSDVIKILERYGYHKTEISLEVFSKLELIESKSLSTTKKVELESAKFKDLPFLKKFANEEFHYGRFLEDSLIKEENARLRTELWIDSLFEDSDTYIIVATYKEQYLGFMAYKQKMSTIELILGGIINKFSHLSLNYWNEIFDHFGKSQDIKFIKTIISARNIGIINLYSSFGFKVINSYVGMHKHR